MCRDTIGSSEKLAKFQNWVLPTIDAERSTGGNVVIGNIAEID